MRHKAHFLLRLIETSSNQKENFKRVLTLFCQMLIVAGGTGPDGDLASTEVMTSAMLMPLLMMLTLPMLLMMLILLMMLFFRCC